jgi:peptidoglycan/LPS O-acetylase OafA/YrhL
VIHPLVGWTIMGILIVSTHVDPAAAAVIAFAIVTALAYLLHVTVEKPTQSLGRSLAESLAAPHIKTLPSG